MSDPDSNTTELSTNAGCAGTGVAIAGAILSTIFLANLTFGIVEIPDNLPLVGNIDEVIASGILFACLSRLGINLPLRWSPPGKTTPSKDETSRLD